MKHYIKSFALIALLCSTTMLNAQTGGDTIKSAFPDHSEIKGVEIIELPVFNGSEQDMQDSLQSVGLALTDTALKSTVLNAVKEIKNMPNGGTVEDWIVWVFGSLAALFGVYQYVRKKLHKTEAKKNYTLLMHAQGKLDEEANRRAFHMKHNAEHALPKEARHDGNFVDIKENRNKTSENPGRAMFKRQAIPDSDKDEAYVKAFNMYAELFGHMPKDNLTIDELEGYIKRRQRQDHFKNEAERREAERREDKTDC